ncbi:MULTISPECIES: shikimate kinase [unclassified Bacillus (in: firmicutes)]|uniref:shikimate kinase n=1 Tax=unclassified Bacillus (in: firmicutes) TaxID=185979 RepID=UPI001BE56B34|nr:MULTISPECIES: shikimate kinase [unclassified Bacillus (in: firmicutes)]MBT2636598.1 shikimate kinase [Bacillus sp. ISL-39]MBT2660837.1 shikimate kinase [Bacillus sp. ISL-45]
MNAIYLIGFMGSGKTTISQELANKLEVSVYDSDQEIVHKAGKTINEIFAIDGEEEFRRLETEVLYSMPEADAVVATGGGIIGAEKNRLFLKEKANVVFLHAEIRIIMDRLRNDDTRPLLRKANREAAETLYHSRLPLYRDTATIEVDTSGKAVSMIVDEIIQRMKK